MQYDFDFDTGSGCVTPGAQTREASYSATPRRGSWSVVTTVSVTEAGGDGIITTEDEANFVSDRVLCWSRCFVIVGRSPTHLAQGGGGGQGGAGVGGHEVTPDVIHSPSGSGVCAVEAGDAWVLVMTGPPVSSPVQIYRFLESCVLRAHDKNDGFLNADDHKTQRIILR